MYPRSRDLPKATPDIIRALKLHPSHLLNLASERAEITHLTGNTVEYTYKTSTYNCRGPRTQPFSYSQPSSPNHSNSQHKSTSQPTTPTQPSSSRKNLSPANVTRTKSTKKDLSRNESVNMYISLIKPRAGLKYELVTFLI